MVPGASKQCLWRLALQLALWAHYARTRTRTRTADPDSFNLTRLVHAGARHPYLFRIPFVALAPVPPCCSPTVKVLVSLTPGRMSGLAFPWQAYQHMGTTS